MSGCVTVCPAVVLWFHSVSSHHQVELHDRSTVSTWHQRPWICAYQWREWFVWCKCGY